MQAGCTFCLHHKPTVPSIHQQTFCSLQASNNGLVTFREHYNSHQTSSFPRKSLPIPLIAPLWAHTIPALSGSVYHRVSQDSRTLEQVALMITEKNQGLGDYSPSIAVIISWFEMRLHEDPDDSRRVAHPHEDGGENPVH